LDVLEPKGAPLFERQPLGRFGPAYSAKSALLEDEDEDEDE
jgi:hypothetical protein